MGRRKIDIVRIENERHRQVTYTKRKAGLLKKATELAILCDAQVAVIIFSQSQKLSVYSAAPMDMLLNRYKEHNDTPEVREPFRSGAANQAAEHRQALAEHTSIMTLAIVALLQHLSTFCLRILRYASKHPQCLPCERAVAVAS